MGEVNEYLKSRYYDPKYPGSYSSVATFYKAIKEEGVRDLTKAQVSSF